MAKMQPIAIPQYKSKIGDSLPSPITKRAISIGVEDSVTMTCEATEVR
jgi:hypothetical protein